MSRPQVLTSSRWECSRPCEQPRRGALGETPAGCRRPRPGNRRHGSGGPAPQGVHQWQPLPTTLLGRTPAVLRTGQVRGRPAGRRGHCLHGEQPSRETPRVRVEGAGVLLEPTWGAPHPEPAHRSSPASVSPWDPYLVGAAKAVPWGPQQRAELQQP